MSHPASLSQHCGAHIFSQKMIRFLELNRPIPNAIGRLSSLEVLRLNHNSLRGTIPSEISDISGLRQLNLHDTLLTGRIPASFNLLADLETFTVNGTSVSGRMPVNLCRIDNLQYTCSSQLCGCADCICPFLRH